MRDDDQHRLIRVLPPLSLRQLFWSHRMNYCGPSILSFPNRLRHRAFACVCVVRQTKTTSLQALDWLAEPGLEEQAVWPFAEKARPRQIEDVTAVLQVGPPACGNARVCELTTGVGRGVCQWTVVFLGL